MVVGSGNHTQKKISENYLQFGYVNSKFSTSPLLSQKDLKDIALKGRQIINMPEEPTCLWQVLFSN
jgi:hypothetical protein